MKTAIIHTMVFALVAVSLGIATQASATMIFDTPSGSSTSGGNVDAQAAFTISGTQLTITLTNLEANPGNVGQNISGLTFSLSPNTGESSATLSSSSGTERTVNSGGTYSNGSSAATGWKLTAASSDIFLDGLSGTYTPAHTIIGPPTAGLYSNANGSIAGNGPHNPFLEGDVQFVVTVPGMAANTTVDDVVFSFGTTAGSTVNGTPTPEPATMSLLAIGGVLAFFKRRNK